MKQMNPNQDFWDEMGRLWRTQPLPDNYSRGVEELIARMKKRRMMRMLQAVSIVILLLVDYSIWVSTPAADTLVINRPSLARKATVCQSLESTLANYA